MNSKFLIVGVAIGFAIAVAPSCGSSTCGPSNCGGCCSANTCIARESVSDTECGSQGVSCSNCVSTSGTCNKSTFACVGGAVDSGTGGGTGVDSGTGGGTGTIDAGVDAGTLVPSGTISCNVQTQNCPTGLGYQCLYIDNTGNGRCFTGDCNFVTQDCAGTDKCQFGIAGDGGVGRVCGPAGAAAEGAACGTAGSDDCVEGTTCVNLNGSNERRCRKYCNSNANCTAGTLCQSLVSVSGTPQLPAICVPVQTCDPLVQNCTTVGEACYPITEGEYCLQAGTAAVGTSCGNVNCVKGAVCLIVGGAGTCKQLCNLDGGLPACAASTCMGLTATDNFGACP